MKSSCNRFSAQCPSLYSLGRWPKASQQRREEMFRLIEAVGQLERIEELARPYYSADSHSRGRPGYSLRMMVRIWVIQAMWNLSPRQAVTCLLDHHSFAHFAGLDAWSARPPSASKISEFARLMEGKAGRGTLANEAWKMLYWDGIRKAGLEFRPGEIRDPVFRRIELASERAP